MVKISKICSLTHMQKNHNYWEGGEREVSVVPRIVMKMFEENT